MYDEEEWGDTEKVVREVASVCAGESPADLDDLPQGSFAFLDDTGRLSSSGRKLFFRGIFTYKESLGGRSVPALAVYFISGDLTDYVREILGLTASMRMGVGPRLIEGNELRRPPAGSGYREEFPLLIEEDAGSSLESVLRGAPIPCEGRPFGEGICLADLEEEQKRIWSAKVAFDILAQTANIHANSRYHRDIRCANIAVRFFGDGGDPATVRATLLDFESLTDEMSNADFKARGYYGPLFEAGGWGGQSPTPCEMDAGYLTIVLSEIVSLCNFPDQYDITDSISDIVAESDSSRVPAGGSQLSQEIKKLMDDPQGFFFLSHAEHFARRVTSDDAARYAQMAGLPTIEETYGAVSPRAVGIARSYVQRSDYLDAHDIEIIESSPEMILEKTIEDRISRQLWHNYNEQRRRGGKPIEYKSFEEQPEDLRLSNVEQAIGVRSRVEELGYYIASPGDIPDDKRVRSLSERQREHVAEHEHMRWCEERERKGWTWGPDRDPVLKKSPSLVPWDQVDEQTKEYDRDFARNLIGLIESVELAVGR